MKYCSHCRSPLGERVPDGDDRPRQVCTGCGLVHFRNPVPVVGCVVERDGQVVLCQRAIEPVRGKWTLPAGYLEHGEGTLEGARRETLEESGLEVTITAPLCQLDLPHIGQVHTILRAAPTGRSVPPGRESMAVRWFPLDRLPLADLAFPVVHFALGFVREDAAAGVRHVHHARLVWSGEGSRFDVARYALADVLRAPLA